MLVTIQNSGVEEVFPKKGGSDEKKSYLTTENRCNCTKWIQHSAVCRHVLFLRQNKGLPLFSVDLFATFYSKSRLEDLDADYVAQFDDVRFNVEVKECNDHDEIEEKVTLEPSEKFKLARETCTEMQELLCNFGTQQFRGYLWEIEILKRRMRRGLPLLGHTPRRNETETKEHQTNEVVPRPQEASQVLEVPALVGKLDFKKTVKARARPRYTGAGKLQFPKPKVSWKCFASILI